MLVMFTSHTNSADVYKSSKWKNFLHDTLMLMILLKSTHTIFKTIVLYAVEIIIIT